MSKKFCKMCPEDYTDTNDTNETASNYSAELSFSTQDSETEVSEPPPSPKLRRSLAARKCTPRGLTQNGYKLISIYFLYIVVHILYIFL